MHTGTLVVWLRIPGAGSLKEKRHVLRGLLAVARRKFNVSIAEVDDQDAWTRAVVGVAAVSNSRQHTNRVLDAVLDHLEAEPEVDVEGVDLQVD